MDHSNNPRSIKFYIKRFLLDNASVLKGKRVVDMPAGNGVTTKQLLDIGAVPLPFDLFPEYFTLENITCTRADISKGIPLADASADMLICQEGLEHFSDQLQALKEFNRVLVKDGTLLITTPNYSNLQSRLSYLLGETERLNRLMPPNELDSIWLTKPELSKEIYLGHVFLIGVQKLRLLAKLAGFKIVRIHRTRIKTTSLLLLPILFPFILCSNVYAYLKNRRKNILYDSETTKQVYLEQLKLSVNIDVLLGAHLMIAFEKEKEIEEVGQSLRGKYRGALVT